MDQDPFADLPVTSAPAYAAPPPQPPQATSQPPPPAPAPGLDPSSYAGFTGTPEQDAAGVARGRIPPDHVRIDPTTGQRVFVGDPATAAANAQQGYGVVSPAAAQGQDPFADIGPAGGVGMDMLRTIPASFTRGLSGLAGLPGDVANLEGNAVDWAADRLLGNHGPQATTDYAGMNGLPTSAQIDQAATRVVPALGYQPQTMAGRAINTAGEFAPSLIAGPQELGARALSYLVPVATSDAAGEAARAFAPPYEQAARAAGGIVGGLGAGVMPGVAPSGAQRVIRAAAAQMTPADVAAAQAVRQTAEGMGAPATLAEASAYAAPGRADSFPLVQRSVEQSSRGGPILAPMMAARPAAQRAAVGQVLDQIAPATTNPSALGPQVQSAATNAISGVRQGVNAAARPLYDASASDLISPSDFAPLAQHPSWQAATTSLLNDPEIGPTVQGMAPNSIDVVDATIKRLRDQAAQARGSALAPGDLQLAAVRDQAADLADRIAAASSPTYAAAKQAVAQGRAAQLDPLTAAATGALSNTGDVRAQTGALWPSAPMPGQAGETAAAIGHLQAQDPTLAPALLRAHLGQAASEAMQDTATGAPVNGGGRFIAGVQGNPAQAQALQAGFAGAAPQAAGPWGDLSDALMAAAKRLPTRPSSPEELAAALKAHAVNGAESTVAPLVGIEALHSPIGAGAALGGKMIGGALNLVNRARISANAKALGEALTAPADQTAQVIVAARTAGDRQRKALAAALVGGTAVAAAPQP